MRSLPLLEQFGLNMSTTAGKGRKAFSARLSCSKYNDPSAFKDFEADEHSGNYIPDSGGFESEVASDRKRRPKDNMRQPQLEKPKVREDDTIPKRNEHSGTIEPPQTQKLASQAMAVRQTKPILVDAEEEEIAVAATPPTNPIKAKDGGPGSKAAVESNLVRPLPANVQPAKSNGVGQPSGMHDSPTTKAA